MKPHLWFIDFVGLIVPRRLRSDWRQEWEAELRHREEMLAEWDRLDWRSKLDLLWRSTSAFWDALVLQPQRLEDEMFQDLRYGMRMLRKHKAVTIVAILSLALGIGANTALFSVIDTVLLKKLAVREPDQLVLFSWRSGPNRTMGSINGFSRRDAATGQFTGSSFSYLTYQRFRAQTSGLADVFAIDPIQQLNVLAGDQSEIATGQFVSGNYFNALGASVKLGRTITDLDDRPDAPPVAVLSHSYWQRRFGGDPAIIGRTVKLNQVICTIIGVTPPEFVGTLQIGDSPDWSLPLALWGQIRQNPTNGLENSWFWGLRLMGRIKPGVSFDQARSSLESVFQQSAMEGWDALPADRKAARGDRGPRDLPALTVESGNRGFNELRREYAWPLQVLGFVVGLVLLIACANVANLLLARAAVRQKEFSVRLALGASRLRLIRQLLTESLLLSLLGGALGVLFGWWAKGFLLSWNPWGNSTTEIDLKLDWRVLGFTALVSLLTGIIFGLAPALRTTRMNLNAELKDEGRGQANSRSRLSKTLIIVQVGLSVVLLIGAGLFVRTLRNLNNVDIGFNQDNLLLFRVDPRLNNYKNKQIAPLYEQMVERLQSVPGVRSATISRHPLLSGSHARMGVSVHGEINQAGRDEVAYIHIVRPNFFETMEIPLLLGRSLSPQDDLRAPNVIVINQALAQRLFKNDNPIGQRLDFENPAIGANFEVVGVVKDSRYSALKQDNPPTVYTSYLQQASPSQMNFEVRTLNDPTTMIPAIREAVRQVDKNLPLFDVKTQSRQIEESISREKAFAQLTTFFGLLALLLACIGLYGVMAYSVAQRTREIGVRMALGAKASDVLRMVMRQGMQVVLIGAVIGLVAALSLTRLVASMLYGVTPNDPLTIGLALLVLLIIAAIAGYAPARRAARVDPLIALRHE